MKKHFFLFLLLTLISTSLYASDSILVCKPYKTWWGCDKFSETERTLRGDFIHYTKENFDYDLSKLKEMISTDTFKCDLWLQCRNYILAFDFVDPNTFTEWMTNAEKIFAQQRIYAAVYNAMEAIRDIPGAKELPDYQKIDGIYQASAWYGLMTQYKVNAVIKIISLKTMKVERFEINTSETLQVFGPFTMFPDAQREKFSLSFLIDLTTVPIMFSDAFKKAKNDRK